MTRSDWNVPSNDCRDMEEVIEDFKFTLILEEKMMHKIEQVALKY